MRGNSALSMAVALNWYLKYTCHCHVSLNGSQLNLPRQLPAVERKVRMTGWAPSRYFFSSSVCVYRDMKPGEPEMTEAEAIPAHPDNEYGWGTLSIESLKVLRHKGA